MKKHDAGQLAFEFLDFEPKALGGGCEGHVTLIAPNLVKKVWGCNFRGELTGADLKRRFKDVERTYHSLPEAIKAIIAIPEFAGYEETETGQVVTYHEYVPGEKNPRPAAPFPLEVTRLFWDVFWSEDYGVGHNVIYSQGKYYLIDTASEEFY